MGKQEGKTGAGEGGQNSNTAPNPLAFKANHSTALLNGKELETFQPKTRLRLRVNQGGFRDADA